MNEQVFCLWYDGPVMDCWTVYFRRGGHRVEICARREVTEAEVIQHATGLYGAYGPVASANRVPVPTYAANRPAAVCPGRDPATYRDLPTGCAPDPF